MLRSPTLKSKKFIRNIAIITLSFFIAIYNNNNNNKSIVKRYIMVTFCCYWCIINNYPL